MNQILVGKPGSKKGLILGGTARAMLLVQAASVGSSAGVKTYIQTGLNPLIQEQLNNIDSGIEANEKSQNGLLDKAHRTLDKLAAELALLITDRESLMTDMSFAEYAKIVVEQGLYNGVEIRIGDKNWKAKEERGKTVFRLIDRKISFES